MENGGDTGQMATELTRAYLDYVNVLAFKMKFQAKTLRKPVTPNMRQSMQALNSRLWSIEDRIRELEIERLAAAEQEAAV
jgi:hypothetical protein